MALSPRLRRLAPPGIAASLAWSARSSPALILARAASPAAPAKRGAARPMRARRASAAPAVPAEPVIAVELAHDFDHVVDRVEIAGAHGAVGDQHRLAQAADLQLDELVGRINGAVGENRRLASPRPLRRYPFIRRNFLDGHACGELFDESASRASPSRDWLRADASIRFQLAFCPRLSPMPRPFFRLEIIITYILFFCKQLPRRIHGLEALLCGVMH